MEGIGHKPKSPSPTRWDGIFDMIGSLLDQFDTINFALADYKAKFRYKVPKSFDTETKLILKVLHPILGVIKSVMLAIQERNSNISLLIPLYFVLETLGSSCRSSSHAFLNQFGGAFLDYFYVELGAIIKQMLFGNLI